MLFQITKRAVRLLVLLLIISSYCSISYSQLKSDTALIYKQSIPPLINSAGLQAYRQDSKEEVKKVNIDSQSKIDTATIRKEILQVLKKHGIKDPSFNIKIQSTNQSGGQTAFEINNYNYKNTFNVIEEHIVNGNNLGINGNVYVDALLHPTKELISAVVDSTKNKDEEILIWYEGSQAKKNIKFCNELVDMLKKEGFKNVVFPKGNYISWGAEDKQILIYRVGNNVIKIFVDLY